MVGQQSGRQSRAVTRRSPGKPALGTWGLVAAGALLALALAACSSPAAAPSASPATAAGTAAATASIEPIVTPKPTSPPRVPAPAELQGRWQTVINDNDKPVLTITDFKYTIERLGIGTGAIEVHGDEIAFFGSSLCSGTGTYRWSIDGGTLTLKAIDTDPCANRADAILNRPFTRMG